MLFPTQTVAEVDRDRHTQVTGREAVDGAVACYEVQQWKSVASIVAAHHYTLASAFGFSVYLFPNACGGVFVVDLEDLVDALRASSEI